MLTSKQKQRALRAVRASDLSSSQKRDLVTKITSKSATPSSISGLLVGVGLGGIAAGIGFGHDQFNKYLDDIKFGSDWEDQMDPSPDNPEEADPGNPGNRVPVEGDTPSEDAPVRHPGDGDAQYDRDGNPLYDEDGNFIGRDDGTHSGPGYEGPGHKGPSGDQTSGGSGSMLGLGELIDALANRFLDFELTGGEREANAFTAEQNRLANEFSAQQAEISRDWQEQMYEKYNSMSGKIAQAESAGVNPMFAVGSGVTPTGFSSPSPSGSSGSSVGASPALTGNLSGLIQSFLGIAKAKSDIEKTKAETSQIVADTNVTIQKLPHEIEKLQSSSGLDKASTNLNLQKIVESATSVEKLRVDMNLSTKQAEMFAEQINYLSAQASYINSIKDSEKRLKEAQATIAQWQEKNKELFKGIDIGTDVVNTLVNIGLGIFNAKTGRIIAGNQSFPFPVNPAGN